MRRANRQQASGNRKSGKVFGVVLCTLLLTLCHVAQAQQPKKVPQIGYLSLGAGIDVRAEAFRKGLRELGYVEGQNIGFEWRFAKGKPDLLPRLRANWSGST
jgi:putative ABC transport system substrate-binding protein